MSILTDESKMPFGVFKGYAMIDVPGAYLLYLWESPTKGHSDVDHYIRENLEAIKAEAKKNPYWKKPDKNIK